MIIVMMGVSGAGKTTIGGLLAEEVGWMFADADSYHSPQNIEKMASGIPLTDADRASWLAALKSAIESWIANRQNVVLACSALKRSYREMLRVGPEVKFIFLRGSFELIESRMLQRAGHFMSPELLRSQFGLLEEPDDAIVVDVHPDPAQIVRNIRTTLNI